MTVHLHPAARAEIRDALSWYEERSPVTATAFASEVESAVHRIADAPSLYPIAEHGTRRLLLGRFPYSVFYRVRSQEIVIVAVAHHKRRPAYWRDR
jgi:toxin ParE1/3/4